jgi:DNA-binding transcriptional ArsR family regulator
METPAPTILRLDPRGLKVLAHPLRSRLLTALREHGPATATTLAQRLGTNTGATSYHLRKLASVGLVEETDDGRGRERWWKAATEMHGWTERDAAGDPDAEAASDWLRRHYLATFVERYGAWLDDHGSWPLAWQDVAGASDYALRLSPTALAAFEADLEALFVRYRAEPSVTADATESEVVQVYLYAFPLRGDRR